MHIDWLQLSTAAISGGGIGWISTFLQDKTKSRAYTMGAVDQAVQTALKSVTDEVDRLNRKLERLSKEHRECLDAHEEAKTKIEDLERKLKEYLNDA